MTDPINPRLFSTSIVVLIMALSTPLAARVPIDPPARYDYPPPMPVHIWMIERNNVWAECSDNGAWRIPRTVAGCQWFDSRGDCVVLVATRSPRATPEQITRHELAHCNGWEH
jgi:hypothetical protein